jgi:hypothetical protein
MPYNVAAIGRDLRVFQALCGSSFLLLASPGTEDRTLGSTEQEGIIYANRHRKIFQ